MAEVALTIAGRTHHVACRDGEEAQLRHLARLLYAHAADAQRAAGATGTGERVMLYIALLLADRLDELENDPPSGVSPLVLARLADRLEGVAAALEDCVANA